MDLAEIRKACRSESVEPLRKRAKRAIEIIEGGQKNPLMALNELKPNLEFEIIASGPPHNTVYTATATIDGKTYTAEDKTKKKAKTRLAQMYLQCAVQLKDPSVRSSQVIASHNEDFSADPSDLVKNSEEFFSFESTVIHKVKEVPFSSNNPADAAKNNPLHILKSLKKDVEIEIIKMEGPSHQRIYTAEGSGSSKKLAKHAAARVALKRALDIDAPRMIPLGEEVEETTVSDFANFVCRLVESTFDGLVKDEILSRYKVLAGIVMTKEPDEPTVICVTTGSKIISGGCLSLEGQVLNDCHAEILARRALVSYLYSQIELFASQPSESIFEIAKNGDQRLKLKANILFHLYISTAPCGDARIFALNESQKISSSDPHPNRQSRGALRTKIEIGEGTVPIMEHVIQTWDGILHSERLLTMSCSDKMARWNVTGVQGSLLSHIINPIYLSTIIVSDCYHQVHLKRALIGRVEHLQGLPSPFVLSRPTLAKTSQETQRQPGKAPKHSIIWTKGWNGYEVIEVSKGKKTDGTISQLSKKSLFTKFLETVLLKPRWKSLVEGHITQGRVAYSDMKRAAREFGEAKTMMVTMFAIAKLGIWVKKPLEQDDFALDFDPSSFTIKEDEGGRLKLNFYQDLSADTA